MRHLESVACGLGRNMVRLGVRAALPDNIAAYHDLGYEIAHIEAHPGGPDQVVTMVKLIATPVTGSEWDGEPASSS